MASIYELTVQEKRLEDAAYSEEIDEEEFNQLLMEIEGEIESKVDGYCAVIADLKADADALKAEADRITARRRSLERDHRPHEDGPRNDAGRAGTCKDQNRALDRCSAYLYEARNHRSFPCTS